MVGLVVVSHSEALAEGVVALAREMGGEELALEAAGGMDEPGALGTDAERVRAAIERAMSDDGVLVLMDLGSALMSTEFAIEMLERGGRVVMSEAPLVEGTVAAAVAARGGASLEEVAAEARGALAMKASQLGVDAAAPAAADSPDAAAPPDAEARLEVRNAIGLHARPAARASWRSCAATTPRSAWPRRAAARPCARRA
ncbi:MAG TPA: dihydroxyacetone kinase phosphoryl donor subunit DhaM [Solirubrobacteraceae bacterium]|nr:dihydroxyacetone kinase phosphoryl donor subunit DhaM [Solirubrobacteraceae bacterium]